MDDRFQMAQPKHSRRSILKLGAGIAAVSVSGGVAANAQVIPTIRYATGGGLGSNELVTMFFSDFMKQKVLKRLGKEYQLDVTYTRGTPEAASLLAAERADLATLSLPAFATAVSRGIVPGGVKAIAGDFQDARAGFAGQGYYALEDSPIRSISDVRGKIIAVNAFGSAVDLIVRAVLKKNGIDPRKDVRIVEIGFPNIGVALREKRADIGVLPLPFAEIERAKGGIRPIFHGADAFPPYAVVFQSARASFLKEHPAAVKAWLADYIDGLNWMYDPQNRKQVVELAATMSKSAPEVIDSYFVTKKDYYRDPKGCLTPDLFQPAIDAMANEGMIKETFDAKKQIDTSFLPQDCS